MCLIFFSINNHPTYKLIVAGNRDEFYGRKTAAASYWTDHQEILGGRDLEAGGTWLAMNKNGRISFITNYRDPKHIDPKAPSRGKLVSDFVMGKEKPYDYLKNIEADAKAYNGFNLVVGDINSFAYLSNYGEGTEKLKSGFYGLSNHLLDTPWPKVTEGKKKLTPILAQERIDPNEVFDLLHNESMADDSKLPSTGVPLELERALSAMFIKTPNYGSRCSTVVLIDQ
ncbi:MAG TPA: NRDE family protein, partial [Cyclobacteriaceae bacterium]|nr:NRDE family protein [Cyclobacteriaceae bacterium]